MVKSTRLYSTIVSGGSAASGIALCYPRDAGRVRDISSEAGCPTCVKATFAGLFSHTFGSTSSRCHHRRLDCFGGDDVFASHLGTRELVYISTRTKQPSHNFVYSI